MKNLETLHDLFLFLSLELMFKSIKTDFLSHSSLVLPEGKVVSDDDQVL